MKENKIESIVETIVEVGDVIAKFLPGGKCDSKIQPEYLRKDAEDYLKSRIDINKDYLSNTSPIHVIIDFVQCWLKTIDSTSKYDRFDIGYKVESYLKFKENCAMQSNSPKRNIENIDEIFYATDIKQVAKGPVYRMN